MKIIPIFGKNLFAIKYAGGAKDEFSRLFELWQNPEYLEDFFEANKLDLNNGFWGSVSVEDAIIETYEHAQEFECKMLELSEQSEDVQLLGLENIFSPLHNSQYEILNLKKVRQKKIGLDCML